MGYHATVQAAIVTLLEAALPSGTPVLNGLAEADAEAHNFASFVLIARESITMEPHAEINPSTSADTQLEEWEWNLIVRGGGGASDEPGKGAQVDLILEKIRTALNAQRPTSDCGPLSILSEEYFEIEGQEGVTYLQRWRHSRMAG